MNQPLFYLPNVSRKEEYRLETRIWNDGSNLKAEKRAANPAASDHLFSMVEKYELLKKQGEFNSLVNIASAKPHDEAVIFNFIAGPNAERMLIEQILENQNKTAIDTLERMVHIIDSLPKKKLNPADNTLYKSIFSDSYDETCDCVGIGIVDLNLDNIIVDKADEWHLIDYEWVFNLPIPRHYLVQRVLWWFTLRHQEAFRYHAQSITMVEIADDIVMPQFIYDKYTDVFASLKKFLKSEDAFQVYVSGKNAKQRANIAIHEKPKIKTFPNLGLERLKRLELHVQELKIKNENLNRNYHNAKTELSSIKDSKFYKLYRKTKKLENYTKKLFK